MNREKEETHRIPTEFFAFNHLHLLIAWGFIFFHFCGMMYYVYITTNSSKSVFYTGMTNNLKRRMMEHRQQKGKWKHFTGRYNCYRLVYYECYYTPMEAIRREKEIKLFKRDKKLQLIRTKNSTMVTFNVWWKSQYEPVVFLQHQIPKHTALLKATFDLPAAPQLLSTPPSWKQPVICLQRPSS